MNYMIKYTLTTCMMAAALTPMPVSAQLGLGRAAGSVGGTAHGTVGDTISQPGMETPSSRTRGEAADGSFSLTQNTALSSRISPLLPATTTLPAAAAGFHSGSDFVATLHAAHNLNIPFEQLKAQTTGKGSVSLGSAIQKLRPDLDSRGVKDNVTLAQHQSERDM
jgi:hypothetical protein